MTTQEENLAVMASEMRAARNLNTRLHDICPKCRQCLRNHGQPRPPSHLDTCPNKEPQP
jgi:hypothetical protein